jgi:hypothetical protein
MIWAPALRNSAIRSICTILFLSLFITFPISTANAAVSITKTVTIKGSNDALYSGAQVGVVYFVDGAQEETFQPLQTSGSNGQVNISYPANASYAQMFITPPESDATNAVEAIDLLTSTDAVIANVKLKAASIRIKPQTPANLDAGLHTCIDYPKVASSRWVTTQYRTTRVGSFGLAIPSALNPARDYQIVVSPCSKSDYNYLAKTFGLRRASNGAVALYTDDTFKTVATATSGIYTLKFDQGKVRGQILDASGNAFTLASGTWTNLIAMPMNLDGSLDSSRNYVTAYQVTPDNKFAFSEPFQEGPYRVYVRSYGANPFPNYIAGEIWVDSTLKFSTTETGTYTSTLDLAYRLPATGILKFAMVDSAGALDTFGGNIKVSPGGSSSKAVGIALSTNEFGFASGQIPDGTYTLNVLPKNSVGLETAYSLTVSAGVVTVRNSSNQVISKVNDYYPLALPTPTIKIRMVSPSDTRTAYTQAEAFLYNSDYSNEVGYLWNETTTSISRLKLSPGTYNLDLSPYGQAEQLSLNRFTIDIDSITTTIRNNGNIIQPTNGIYILAAKKPTFTGTVLNPAGTEAVRWASVSAVNANNSKYRFSASTNSTGDFAMDLGSPIIDGLYYVTATPPVGVNANYGTSDSVSVLVTGGVPDLSSVTIRLRAANVSGVVSGPNGPSPQNWLTVQESKTGTYLDPTIDGPLTDEDGGYSLYLPNGNYGITPSSDYANTGGVSNGTKTCTATTSPTTCNISLLTPNVSGTVTLAGEKPLQSMVGFAPLASDPLAQKLFASKYGGTLWSGWSDINKFGLKIDSGTYRMWIAYQTYTNEQSTVPGPICVVPESGAIVCDATLPAANLKIQVADWSGNAVHQNVSAAIQYKDGSNYFWTCCSNSDPTLLDGKIQVGLINGSYKLLLNSTENLSDGVQQTYYFDVSGGAVSNMRLTESGTTISSADGLYTLRLKEPVVSGTLYGTNGTTPKLFTEVRLYNASGQNIDSVQTDRLGRFAFNPDAPLASGTYFVAGIMHGSLTEANSKYESFTVSNGKATTTITLKLNTPNIVGNATGPLGISPKSFIRAQAITSTSIFATDFTYTFTDDLGKFAFYLPTGTYTFYGDSNFEKTGGVSGSSAVCAITAETTTISICNIIFATPNVTGTISNGGTTAANSYVLFFPAYGIAGNTANNSYGWIYSSSGKYGISAGPGTYRSYTLNYLSNGGRVITPGPLCVVPASGSVVCDISKGTPNFKFLIKNYSGTSLTSDFSYSFEVMNGDQWQGAGSSDGVAATLTSQFLFDGSYRLKVTPYGLAASDGTLVTFTFDVTNGSVSNLQRSDSNTLLTSSNGIYTLQTIQPNVQGVISGANGVATNVWVEVLQVFSDGKGTVNTGYSATSGKDGKFALRLPVGLYLLKAHPDYAATGGGDTSVRCEVTSETASVVTCNIVLTAPNVSGSVKVAGTNVQVGSVLLVAANGIAGNKASNSYSWANINNGNFGITATPGTYRILMSLQVINDWEVAPAGLCVVPETGTVTCNVNLPNVNFVASVLDTNGVEIGAAGIEVAAVNGDSWDAVCCNNQNSNTKRQALALPDGLYRLRVFPQGSGGSQVYLLKIETGTVKSLKALGSNSEVVAVNGAYPLRLKPPTFSGIVYKPGGTTPAANTYVLAQSDKSGYGFWTNADGKFTFDVDPSVTDAIFTFTAQPNRMTYQIGINIDKTLGSSAPRFESVTAGVGNQNISISLRNATVTGRVSGYKGALINRDITFQKLDGAGNWNWTNINAYTDKSGDFSEYLSTGTYRLFSWGDTKGAGGGETYGNPCAINAESGTATTCNLSLVAPNVTGVAKFNGVAIDWGQVEFQPDSSIKTNTERRSYWSSVDQGIFGATMKADTYQISIWFSINGKYNRVFGPKCVVPETGTVTCDFNLPGINLSYKVLDSNNNLLTANVYSSLEIKSGDSWIWSCCSYPDSNLRDGKLDATLVDGSYRLGVRPDNASVAGSTQNYTFTVESGTVKNFAIEGASETVSVISGVFITKLRPAALTGMVYKLDGTTPYVNARVCARPTSEKGNWWRICTGTNNAGKFTFDQANVTDDAWIVQAFSTNNDLTQGSSIQDSVTVSAGLGSKILALNLRAPTVSGIVTGPLGASPNNYINVRKYYDNGGYDYVDVSFLTDSQGRYAFTLEPGRYKLQAQNDMAVAGGTSAMSADCIVTSSSPITCNISLQAPNVTGTVTIGGQIASASVELVKESSWGFESLGFSSGTNQSGGYAMTVAPGTYRTRIYLYSSGNWMLGPPCIVQTGINSICNVTLPSANFQFKVNKASGTLATSGINVNYYFKSGDRLLWAGNASMDSNGQFKNSLVDGTYVFDIEPNGTDATMGSKVSYTVVVESSTAQSVTREGSNTPISTSAGFYTFLLGVPSISGTVVAQDGTTPVPNARVLAFLDPYNRYETSGDQSAAYGFAKLPDGTYSVIAAPNYGDATKAQSLPTQIKVVNGVGANEVKLALRTPNVTGVVRGTNGKVAKYNWLGVEQKMSGGWWKTPDYFVNSVTSAEGSFGFYLEPGIYRIRAQGDMKSAGGVATVVFCTVPSSGSVTCDITLKSPNLKIRIVAPGSTTYNQGSWAWTYLQSTSNQDAITNSNPNFEWDQDGNYQTVLEDGTWILRTDGGDSPLYSNTQFTVVVSGGVVTQVTNANNETVTATAGTYLLPLIGSNLTGTISFNNVTFDGGASIQVLRQEGDYWYYYSSKWSSTGTFGFLLPAGNYKVEVIPYWNNQNIVVATTKSALCVVETTGTTTCNIALKAPNLHGKITDQLGAVFRYSDAYMLVQQQNQGEQWLRWLNLTDGLFDTYLEDGSYRLQVMPRWEYRATYTDRSYIIKVESGTITSILDPTGAPLSASNGLYSFALGTPSVVGRVFNPGSATAAANVNIVVAPAQSPAYWKYSTQSDANGNFALTVPNGTYVVQAMPTNGGFQFGKSETKTIVIAGGVLSGIDSVTLVLRNPNLTGRIVTPGANPQPLANVNVNIYIDGEFFYGWTDSDGRFGTYVDNPNPQCPSRCSINLNYFKSSLYTPKYYSISSVGSLGDLAIGGVTSQLTVKVPQVTGTPLASKYSWVSVERVYGDGTRAWVTSGSTDENGTVGLSLDTGAQYWIWAYPNGEQSNGFAPKKYEIPNYSPETNAVLNIVFDMPNVKLKVQGSNGSDNTYGWYTVSTWDSATSTATKYSNASLDSKGLSALTLADGDYQLRFWPGQAAQGVQKIITFRVSGSTVTWLSGNVIGSDSISGNLVTVKLASGNISGTIIRNGAGVTSALVAAYRADDLSKFITTSSDADGNYQLNLDLTYSWIVKSVDPVSSYSGSITIASRSPSNDVLASQNINLSTAP